MIGYSKSNIWKNTGGKSHTILTSLQNHLLLLTKITRYLCNVTHFLLLVRKAFVSCKNHSLLITQETKIKEISITLFFNYKSELEQVVAPLEETY